MVSPFPFLTRCAGSFRVGVLGGATNQSWDGRHGGQGDPGTSLDRRCMKHRPTHHMKGNPMLNRWYTNRKTLRRTVTHAALLVDRVRTLPTLTRIP